MSVYLHEGVHMTEWVNVCCEGRHERYANQSRESESQRWPEEIMLCISESETLSDTGMRQNERLKQRDRGQFHPEE